MQNKDLDDVQPVPHLSQKAKAFWRWATTQYTLKQYDLQLLLMACEALDRCMQARKALKRNGLIYADRFGQPRARPEVKIEKDSKLVFARIISQLNLKKLPSLQAKQESEWTGIIERLNK